MKYNYIATFQIRLLQCRYLSTKVTPLLRSLWPSPMGDRYRGVRLYMQSFNLYMILPLPDNVSGLVAESINRLVSYICNGIRTSSFNGHGDNNDK